MLTLASRLGLTSSIITMTNTKLEPPLPLNPTSLNPIQNSMSFGYKPTKDVVPIEEVVLPSQKQEDEGVWQWMEESGGHFLLPLPLSLCVWFGAEPLHRRRVSFSFCWKSLPLFTRSWMFLKSREVPGRSDRGDGGNHDFNDLDTSTWFTSVCEKTRKSARQHLTHIRIGAIQSRWWIYLWKFSAAF